MLLVTERYAQAEAAYREAARLDPSDAAWHSGLGTALSRLKRYKEADAAYKEAACLDPAYRGKASTAARILRRGLGSLQSDA